MELTTEQNLVKRRIVATFSYLKHKEIVRNQNEFAEKIKYSKTHISEIMNGHKPVTQDLANAIEVNFGVSEKWLMSGKGDAPEFVVNAAKNPVETRVDNTTESVDLHNSSPLNEKDMTIHTLAAANRDLAETNRKVVSEMLELSKELRVLLHEMKQEARPKSKAS